jgi:hypothetical protein
MTGLKLSAGEIMPTHPIMAPMFGADYGSFVLYLKCVSFGGEFFEEFYLIIGLFHGSMSWRTVLVVFAKLNLKI